MTTYESFEAAKIANPDCEIVTNGPNWNGSESLSGKFQALIYQLIDSFGWIVCNPADYCMSVEQFLNNDHKFIDGDAYIDSDGVIRIIGSANHSKRACNKILNICRPQYSFILRAAALEEKEKPKRVKFSYELLCNTNFNVWGLKELLDNGDLFYLINDEYVVVPSGSDIFAIEHFLSGNIYRRVEAEISERDEFIGVIKELEGEYTFDDNYDTEQFGEFLFDSRKFKLVD